MSSSSPLSTSVSVSLPLPVVSQLPESLPVSIDSIAPPVITPATPKTWLVISVSVSVAGVRAGQVWLSVSVVVSSSSEPLSLSAVVIVGERVGRRVHVGIVVRLAEGPVSSDRVRARAAQDEPADAERLARVLGVRSARRRRCRWSCRSRSTCRVSLSVVVSPPTVSLYELLSLVVVVAASTLVSVSRARCRFPTAAEVPLSSSMSAPRTIVSCVARGAESVSVSLSLSLSLSVSC